ncbi:A/G-specific adenine glycosylase [Hugenholtzia roseola]|uniref:A/G-specific adenine glycosylase n=1 Tax=Hugenholtzia roseola TaxID=1002 RepID=UPI0003F62C37|nr:A/G-specific adenine glycosylase [Hugenholtzia roseola]
MKKEDLDTTTEKKARWTALAPLFSAYLQSWFAKNKRDLPWRKTQDPYKIWLSEIILQQTRVVQGLPYYEKFVAAFPTVSDLAAAEEQQVLRLWQGLGYYSRARNLHQTAKFIAQELGGIFPQNYESLLALKGVGTYTAAAIASFAFDEKVAVLDGNVFRVVSRFLGIEEDIASPKAKKIFTLAAQTLLEGAVFEKKGSYSVHNQAIMEFGALHCTPLSPACQNCGLQTNCYAFQEKKQHLLPLKIKKTKIKTQYFHYLVFKCQSQMLCKLRQENDIWQGLHDFVLIESQDDFINSDNFTAQIVQRLPESLQTACSALLNTAQIRYPTQTYKHQLTHRTLWVRFYEIEIEAEINTEAPYFWASLEVLERLPKPILIENYLKTRSHKLF